MRISDEIGNAVTDNAVLEGYTDDGYYPEIMNPKEIAEAVIQAYLSEIWKPFDAEDESTWPDEDNKIYILLYVNGPYKKYRAKRFYATDIPTEHSNWYLSGYLDPADILPKEDK